MHSSSLGPEYIFEYANKLATDAIMPSTPGAPVVFSP